MCVNEIQIHDLCTLSHVCLYWRRFWLTSSFVVMDDEVVGFPTEVRSIQDMNQDLIQYGSETISGSSTWGLFSHTTSLMNMNHFSFMSWISRSRYILIIGYFFFLHQINCRSVFIAHDSLSKMRKPGKDKTNMLTAVHLWFWGNIIMWVTRFPLAFLRSRNNST